MVLSWSQHLHCSQLYFVANKAKRKILVIRLLYVLDFLNDLMYSPVVQQTCGKREKLNKG